MGKRVAKVNDLKNNEVARKEWQIENSIRNRQNGIKVKEKREDRPSRGIGKGSYVDTLLCNWPWPSISEISGDFDRMSIEMPCPKLGMDTQDQIGWIVELREMLIRRSLQEIQCLRLHSNNGSIRHR